MSHIHFHSEDVPFPNEVIPEDAIKWLEKIAIRESREIGELNYIFCSDDYLLKVNQEYLNHDFFTDIITFDYSESHIEGDIYISVDRVKENAMSIEVSFKNELHRVLAHGLLHLLGYKDKSEKERKEMRLKEEACLSLLL